MSGTSLSIPLALKRKKSLNNIFPRTVQIPSEAFKPADNNSKKDGDSQLDDMEVDENNNTNAIKTRTLACFYPSSIRASKGLDKTFIAQDVICHRDENMSK